MSSLITYLTVPIPSCCKLPTIPLMGDITTCLGGVIVTNSADKLGGTTNQLGGTIGHKKAARNNGHATNPRKGSKTTLAITTP